MQTLLGDTPTPKNKKKERKKSDNYIDNYMYLDIAKMFTSLPSGCTGYVQLMWTIWT